MATMMIMMITEWMGVLPFGAPRSMLTGWKGNTEDPKLWWKRLRNLVFRIRIHVRGELFCVRICLHYLRAFASEWDVGTAVE